MIVLRKTMEAAVEAERERAGKERVAFYQQYGEALNRVTALQKQMAAWITNETGNITPEQFADMFYAHDDSWQAAFFNVMQARVKAHHDAMPPTRPGEWPNNPGVPAGEAQWWHMAQKLDDAGFETLEAMFDHAKSAREKDQAA